MTELKSEHIPHTSGLSVRSDTLASEIEAGKIARTSTGLLDGAFLLGSTNSRWREEGVEKGLNEAGVTTYNPNMGENRDSERDTKAEAIGMSEFSVLSMYIENAEGVENGSLGSLVEIGIAVYSALINGQIVNIHFDTDFFASLTDAGALAQMEGLRVQLDAIKEKYPQMLFISYKSSRDEYQQSTQIAVEKQRNPDTLNQPITFEKLLQFEKKRLSRMRQPHRMVVMSGSSAPFDQSLQSKFEMKQNLIQQVWGGSEKVISLNQPPFSELWAWAYSEDQQIDVATQTLRMRTAFTAEQGLKEKADVVVWSLQAESSSMAAVTETAFLLFHALENGQQVSVLSEKFDEDEYAGLMFAKKIIDLQEEVGEDPIFARLAIEPEKVTFADIKKSKLKNSVEFTKMNSIRRTRLVAYEQLKRLQQKAAQISSGQEIELFTMSGDISDFIQKNQLLTKKESFEGREIFFDNYMMFKANLEVMLADASVSKDNPFTVIFEAIKKTIPLNEKAASLMEHLHEVQVTMDRLRELVVKHPGKDGQNFLSQERMDLLVNYVAPLHDILKLLGPPNVQSIPDHEILIGYIVSEYFGKLGFSVDEVEFMSSVISNHENIFKEAGRSGYAKSPKESDRGSALFFLADTLTGVLEIGDEVITLNAGQLRSRFTDLYVRHMDPGSRKIALPRPEWGIFTVKDYLATFAVLEDQYGIKFAPDARQMLVVAAIEGIDITRANDEARRSNAENKIALMSEDELRALETTKQELQEIQAKL